LELVFKYSWIKNMDFTLSKFLLKFFLFPCKNHQF